MFEKDTRIPYTKHHIEGKDTKERVLIFKTFFLVDKYFYIGLFFAPIVERIVVLLVHCFFCWYSDCVLCVSLILFGCGIFIVGYYLCTFIFYPLIQYKG